MTGYIAPLEEIIFALYPLAGFDQLAELPGFEDASPDLVEAILEQAAKLATEVVAPLNQVGDTEGVSLSSEHQVTTASGFKQAYQQYVTNGWGSLQFDPALGGQGLPFSLAIAVQELWHAANLAWGLCPLLSQGAVEAISANASEPLKARFLPAMISGAWTGTMNLTEPQAGSDLAAIRTSAVREGDHYRIRGQKIFITWGEHDMAENIIHLVLARLPDAPAGARGISLFLVPKFLANEDGSLGPRNDCIATALEHKIGIHASPTCVMSFGDNEGAIGYLVGHEHQGLGCMFTMMNNARLTVGLQGVAIAERAYQQADQFARERVQGHTVLGATPIIGHPDVRRMLMTIKALTQAGRALAYAACIRIDWENADLEEELLLQHQRRVGVLTPMVKGWCTEMAQEAVSLAVQIHGGMGFIEETGVGQYFRDARILPIYEGTNGIQAMDLIGRKTLSDNGLGMFELIKEMSAFSTRLSPSEAISAELLELFAASISALSDAVSYALDNASNKVLIGGIAFNYLLLASTVTAAWQMLRAAEIAQQRLAQGTGRTRFYRAKLDSCRFFIGQILPRYLGYVYAINSAQECIAASHAESL
ncbi:MAG: alkylation response protein AidB-like acyl-CoA dehydrogenase [Motiliproteus sp.]|jgi:alkylation response protein AidB-like acyl-CoA dehydrogenase